MNQSTTVCALSTPRGKGGIAVIRISGEKALEITEKTVKSNKKITRADGYTIVYGKAYGKDREIDEVLVSVFRAPNSFTGENVCEISCHGSMLSAERIIDALLENGASLATKGEFTKRAFLNGKMSLTQAEAVNDIIESKTDEALYAAVNRLNGVITKPIVKIREELLDLLAAIQVSSDFPEEDIDTFAGGELIDKLTFIENELLTLKKSARRGEALNQGITCAICGIPNTGKSSLLNALVEKNKAIVTDIAGTTRDVVEEYADIDGIPVKFGDTAGIRESSDKVEAIGVKMSHDYIENADICIFVTECGRDLTDEEREILEKISEKEHILVANKNDLSQKGKEGYIEISAKEEKGIEAVKKAISDIIGHTESHAFIANERQFEAVLRAAESIKKAKDTITDGLFSDLAAIDIGSAIACLGEAEGISINQETVDRIFEKFCLGK
ncbi:MAG: tRNA uridine-5-carboxymethylaminomethyl(34) synthesis GTPase MnmE [Clostridia bacterium]|nr:tRNA uridine-5-carboxymethylaminomethyl(34) synthesis GTPase MnmE [Clostridia bacterium]